MKAIYRILIVSLLVVGFSPLLRAEDGPSLPAVFASHCGKCHGQSDEIAADVDLLAVKSERALQKRPQLLERLRDVLRDREMPPEDETPLSDELRQQVVAQLEQMLNQAAATAPFGPTPMRRMNRFEYNNAVVDLLELDRDIFQLNERLMRRRNDYFRPETRKMPDQLRVSSRPLSKDIDNQRPEGFKDVAAFPQDQRAEHGFDNRADHLTLSPLLMESFLKLSQTIVESSDLNPRECRSWDEVFAPPGQPARAPVAGRFEGEIRSRTKLVAVTKGRAREQDMRPFGDGWSGNAQLIWVNPETDSELTLSIDVAEGGSGLRLGLTKARDFGTFEVYFNDQLVGDKVDLYDPRVIRWDHDLPNLAVGAGEHTLRFKCVGKHPKSRNHFFGLDYVDVTGRPATAAPPPPGSEFAAVETRLQKLLRRAFRRPVDTETLDRFTTFARGQLEAGESFEDTMRTVVGAVLSMPEFLYFSETVGNEPAENPGRQPIDDFELAARLARFFWSSIPDDELLDLAEKGELGDPATLSEQIDRMLNDRRSSRFCDNFPAQWLQLDRLVTSIPDREKYAYFYYNGYRTSMHMMSEPLLLFETVFVEDRSALELIDPKFTWESDMLRSNYEGKATGDRAVQVQTFRRVSLEDPRRGGVITNAAVMTMTSTPVRTQPITRGAWVNAVIFNDPPEPPPADVPPLPEVDAEALRKLTIRERLAAHRQRADCAGCHNKIDPLGFALENYGPTGVWRDTYENGREVDSGGVLFNQHEFQSVVEFKRLLVQEKDRFLRGFVSHLLTYALGRELGPADVPAVDDMTTEAAAGDDQLRTLMKRVAMSAPFLHKNLEGREDSHGKGTIQEHGSDD